MADDIKIAIDGDVDIKALDAPGLQDSAMEMAKRIASIAQSTAPVESGDYAGSIVAEKTKHGARVFAGDYKSAWIEFGIPSQGKPAHFNLRRAVEAAGYGFRKK